MFAVNMTKFIPQLVKEMHGSGSLSDLVLNVCLLLLVLFEVGIQLFKIIVKLFAVLSLTLFWNLLGA